METMSVPQGEFALELGGPSRRPRRPWDAADEYVLHHLAATGPLPPGRVVVLNAGAGATAVALAQLGPDVVGDSLVDRRTTLANLDRNGVAGGVSLLGSFDVGDGPIGALVVKIPRTVALLEDQLRRVRPHLTAETVVVGAGMTRHVHASTSKLFERLIGPTATSLARKKARLLHAVVDLDLDVGPDPWPRTRVDDGITVVNHPGVFARDRLDHGTAMLLANLPAPGASSVADLGCGNGVLGVAYAMSDPAAVVTFLDESDMAIASAEATFRANLGAEREAGFVLADGVEGVDDASLDLVLCNPPFHDEHAVGDEVAWRMFSGVRRALAPGGELWVVGNRHLGYHAKLKRLFGNCDVIASDPKFVVLRAAR